MAGRISDPFEATDPQLVIFEAGRAEGVAFGQDRQKGKLARTANYDGRENGSRGASEYIEGRPSSN